MKYFARHHPIAFSFAMLILGPYLLALVLLIAVFYVIAAAVDMLAYGHR